MITTGHAPCRDPRQRAPHWPSAQRTSLVSLVGTPQSVNLPVPGRFRRTKRRGSAGSATHRPAARLPRSGSPIDDPCTGHAPRSSTGTRPHLHRLSSAGREERVVARGRRRRSRRSTGRVPRSRRSGTRTRGAPAPHDRVPRPGGPPASVHPGPAGHGGPVRRPPAPAPRPDQRNDRQKLEQQLMSTR